MLYGLLGFLIMLPIVVLVHEFGHFITARKYGVKVLAFSIGFGKAFYKWTDSKGTEWRIGWLPLGGYVSLYGQDMMFEREKFQQLSEKEKQGHYLSISAWKQAIIISAGVICNFILAYLIYLFLFSWNPIKYIPAYVGEVVSNSEASKQNIKSGDLILSINNIPVNSFEEVKMIKVKHPAKEYNVEFDRNGKKLTAKLSGDIWGIVADEKKEIELKKTPGLVLEKANKEFWIQSSTIYYVLKQIITGDRSSKQLGSFLTIAEVSGMALMAGLATFLSLIAMISINLGVINLLPIPALDGGYLLILLVEFILRKKLTGRYMRILLTIGWIFLIGIFILTMKNDIVRVILK